MENTQFAVNQDEINIGMFNTAQEAIDFASNMELPKFSTIYVDVMEKGKKEPSKTLATRFYDGELEVLSETLLSYYTSKTVKSYDGNQDVNIKAHQDYLTEWPLHILEFLDDNGKAGLMNAIYSTTDCGCKIIGNGTLQFPLKIKFCSKHK